MSNFTEEEKKQRQKEANKRFKVKIAVGKRLLDRGFSLEDTKKKLREIFPRKSKYVDEAERIISERLGEK